jgi:Protein of unknown function (DUF2892)
VDATGRWRCPREFGCHPPRTVPTGDSPCLHNAPLRWQPREVRDEPHAHQILDARFALAEISKEEYEDSKTLTQETSKNREEIDMNATANPSETAPRGQHVPKSPKAKVRGLRRPSINITPPERVGRVLLGAAAVTAGALLLVTAGTILSVSLEVLLILTGLDLVITGALGHCPLYRRLGYVPSSLRRPA